MPHPTPFPNLVVRLLAKCKLIRAHSVYRTMTYYWQIGIHEKMAGLYIQVKRQPLKIGGNIVASRTVINPRNII